MKILSIACLVVVLNMPAPAFADQLVRTVASVSSNSRADVLLNHHSIPACPHKWSVKTVALHGGKQDGVQLIEVNNGPLTIVVIPTRGMGILSVTTNDGTRIGWNSPVTEVVHPRHINLNSRGGLGWLEGFNEWMCRCGLESNGHPGTDKFINNVGDEAEMELTLHGKISNLPAQEVEIAVDKTAPFAIHIRGRVDEKMFYGPKLELWTDLTVVPGKSGFAIHDRIVNKGAQDQEYQLLYHTNFGQPLLEGNAKFVAPIAELKPFNANAAKGMATYKTYAAPTVGFVEQVYMLKPFTTPAGDTKVMLKNAAGTKGVSMKWSVSELPYLTLWKNTAAVEDGYVSGIEPGTNYPQNRQLERAAGRVPKIAPGATVEMHVEFGFHNSAAAVNKVAAEITAIQGDRKTKIDPTPAQ